MTKPFDSTGAQAVHDLWLGLIPQFFGQFGVKMPPTAGAGAHADGAGQGFDWLKPWMQGLPPAAMGKSAEAAGQSAQAMFAPWAAMMTPYPSSGASTDAPAATAGATGMFGPWTSLFPLFSGAPTDAAHAAASSAMQPFQAAQQSWIEFIAQMGSASPQSFMTGFDRTFGGLFDALGFGPMRKLQAAYQELASAGMTQNQSRAAYAMLVQGAFATGLERLMTHLAKMAEAGERVESVLALLRMWAVHTEEAVHEVLQSEGGLAATAALTRAGLSHRRKLQHVAAIAADSLDLATRRELDEVYRELHELKRELRALRATAPPGASVASKPRSKSIKRKTKR